MPETQPRDFAVCRAIEMVGDRWSLLVIWQLLLGVTRFNAIQRQTGAPRDRLADRLRKLQQAGVITRHTYRERPRRYEYRLTPTGQALEPVLDALQAWGFQ